MKFFKNFSIKYKLIVIVLTVALLAISIGSSFVVINNIRTFKADMVNTTNSIAKFVADACGPMLAFFQEDEIVKELKKLRGVPIVEYACVYNEKGEVIKEYPEDSKKVEPPPLIQKRISSHFEGNYLHVFHPIHTGASDEADDEWVATLYMRASTALLDKKISEYMQTMLLGLLGLVVLTYFLAARLQRVISRPILHLAEVTEHITKDADFEVRVRKEGDDEIGTLYTGFNNMLEQLQLREKQRDAAEAEQTRLNAELEEKNKELEQVVYVTSHDLRSPLVNIQGFSKELGFSLEELSALLAAEDLPAEVKERFALILEEDIPDSLKYILSSTNKMDSLLTGLLKLSRVGRTATTFGNIDMNELISEINNAFEFHFKEAEAEFITADLPSCYGNDVQLNQLFSNLVNNALKYRSPDRPPRIEIAARREDGRIIYSVSDNGQGIAEEHVKKVFEIFHRLNPEDSQGEGLGLTIVNKIVGRHNGKIWVESEYGKGSTFFVSLHPSKPGTQTVKTDTGSRKIS